MARSTTPLPSFSAMAVTSAYCMRLLDTKTLCCRLWLQTPYFIWDFLSMTSIPPSSIPQLTSHSTMAFESQRLTGISMNIVPKSSPCCAPATFSRLVRSSLATTPFHARASRLRTAYAPTSAMENRSFMRSMRASRSCHGAPPRKKAGCCYPASQVHQNLLIQVPWHQVP